MAGMNWLFKEEPSNYNFDALVKDKKTVWSGVKSRASYDRLPARISLPTASTRSSSRRMFSPRMFFTSCSE
jgi:hypothetical protein